MSMNVGSVDRMIRLLLGVVALVALLVGPLAINGEMGITQYILAAVGVILVGTSIFKFCPAYRVFGFRTCKID